MKPPAFQFYADDFLAGVADMTQAEVGAYILLLCAQWSRGEIPTDPSRAAMIAKGDVPPLVAAKFPSGKNERMERERAKQAAFREACAAAGRKGGGNPSFKTGAPNPYYGDKDKGADKGETKETFKGEINSPSPSPSPSPVSVTDSLVVVEPAAPATTSTRKPRAQKPTDAEWLESLKVGPAYEGIDIDREFDKCVKYFADKSISPTRQRFLNWLNRANKPLQARSNLQSRFAGAF